MFELVRDIFIGILILFATAFAMYGFTQGDLEADSSARNLGATMNILSAEPYNITLNNSCPEDTIFKIEDNSITATVETSLGEGSANYHYISPSNANLPSKTIDCSKATIIQIRKYTDSSGITVIDVEGI